MPENRPIFIVGSPRSGTSVFTWCLGQHSNIFVQEESNWIGRFAYQIELAYRVGTARGERSQLSALDVERGDFFERFGATINSLVLEHRTKSEARIAAKRKKREEENPELPPPPTASPLFRLHRARTDRKERWVDGTPEYSFYILPLRLLFPEARFIHLVREVEDVVRSMMHFQNTGGPALVENVREAYREWLTAARACHVAERAYGREIVRRVRYADLIANPQTELEKLLAFLGEEFEPGCLDPLRQRINSSKVPNDAATAASDMDAELVQEARALSAELLQNPQPNTAEDSAAAEMEERFRERADYLARAVT